MIGPSSTGTRSGVRVRSRREFLRRGAGVAAVVSAAGWVPVESRAQPGLDAAAFDARSADEVWQALRLGSRVESPDIRFSAPEIAENGAVVPIEASTSLPGVQRLVIVVEKNPAPLAAVFSFSDAVETRISTRIKMSQTSNVIAAAVFADGTVQFAQRQVTVILGGCGD